jgi:catechol 2,3-dioxygenase-like lactoylglutathione lyase family enzyme
VDYKLEVVVVPVADVDRAKNFYKALGWREDADHAAGADFRVVQLTPPGSSCSIIFGTGITSAAAAGPAPDHTSYGSFASCSDPDGNGWFLQEITTRLPGR